ncbi:UNVERIFIED_CONTAM: Tetratricopeptide repeat protein 25 [Siphonaria sp. JEL0065]|nr:Tetratricopeptide repeat protein 25 [Siphonaria sp. JEL0065]
MADKKKAHTDDDEEQEIDPKDVQGLYQALHAEADKLAASGQYAEAVDKYNRALVLHPNQLDCLVNRARCYMMQGDTTSSLEDVNTVLALSPEFIRAIYQKAVTLYARGDFEDALVLFHRGAKARPELVGFSMGIHKSIEAIKSAVVLLDTVTLKERLNKKRGGGDAGKSMAELQGAGKTVGGAAAAARKSMAVLESNKNRVAELDRGAVALQQERNLIEELQDDKLFLLELLSDTRLCQSCNGEIEQLVNEGLDYIETRVEFWRQGNPNAAAIATVKAAVMGSKLNLAHEELVALKGKKKIGRGGVVAGVHMKTGSVAASPKPADIKKPKAMS